MKTVKGLHMSHIDPYCVQKNEVSVTVSLEEWLVTHSECCFEMPISGRLPVPRLWRRVRRGGWQHGYCTLAMSIWVWYT